MVRLNDAPPFPPLPPPCCICLQEGRGYYRFSSDTFANAFSLRAAQLACGSVVAVTQVCAHYAGGSSESEHAFPRPMLLLAWCRPYCGARLTGVSRSCGRRATTQSPMRRWASASTITYVGRCRRVPLQLHRRKSCTRLFPCSLQVAVAARAALDSGLGITRVLIVDWDVHHGAQTLQLGQPALPRSVVQLCGSAPLTSPAMLLLLLPYCCSCSCCCCCRQRHAAHV